MKSLKLVVSAGMIVSAFTGMALSVGVTTSSAAPTPPCVSSQIKVSHGAAQGTAGTTYYPIVFTNKGAACTIWGVPSIQPVIGVKHASLGPAARNNSMGEMPVMQKLAKGASVSDAFGVVETGNYTPSACVARHASGVIVTLGSFVHPTFVPLSISVCTRQASTSTRLVAPGVNG